MSPTDCSTHQALLSFTIYRSLLRFVSIESVALTIISSALYPEGNAVASSCTLQPGKPKSGAFLPPDPRKRGSSAVSSLLFILFKLQPFIYTILFACNVSFFYLTEVLPADGEIFFFFFCLGARPRGLLITPASWSLWMNTILWSACYPPPASQSPQSTNIIPLLVVGSPLEVSWVMGIA